MNGRRVGDHARLTRRSGSALCGSGRLRRLPDLEPELIAVDGAQRQDCARPVDGKRQATEPNSTSTGVGVMTSVLNFNLPFESWIRKTAIESVFWFAA